MVTDGFISFLARKHIHISSSDGEAKFWLEPKIELANHAGFSKQDINQLQKLVEEHAVDNIIKITWDSS